MANKRIYPPCIHCGAQRDSDGQPTAKAEMTAWANDGEIPLYYLKCLHCEKHWIAFIGSLPAHASLSALDETLRIRLRDRKRAKFGYLVPPTGSTRGGKRYDSDRIIATIRIAPGRISKGLAKKLNRNTHITGRLWRNNPDFAEEIA